MDAPAGLLIRPELKSDYEKITALHDLAFGQKGEGRLVEALRRNPVFIRGLSLVALLDGNLVGHILFFPVLVRDGQKVFRSLALAPLAVLPNYQRKGIGSALVIAGIDEAREGKHRSVIVLGHREYYPGFGFRPAIHYGILPPFDVPSDVFFAMELIPGGLAGVSGTVEYPPEFSEF
ncbi:MAG: putative acetyltransferase [Bacteroidetes bacterium]|nr:MAG: putative acetyltransferase [Bacteroidota bacterium]